MRLYRQKQWIVNQGGSTLEGNWDRLQIKVITVDVKESQMGQSLSWRHDMMSQMARWARTTTKVLHATSS